MAAVERAVRIADLGKLLDADAAVEPVQLLGQHQHQAERGLGAGDVGAPADGEHLDVALRAGVGVDLADHEAVFVDRHKILCGRDIVARDGKRFHDQTMGIRDGAAQLVGRGDEPHLRRHEIFGPRPHAIAPAVEIRHVVSEKIRVSRAPLGARGRIEDERHDARERVVFDHNDARRGMPYGSWCGSGSISSARSTRVCML